MAIHELGHPLGQDIEKIHGALLAGADRMLGEQGDAYTEKIVAQFKDPFETGKGFSRLKLANWTTKRLVWIEYPVAPEDESAWSVDWGTGAERSLQRISIRDMLYRGFYTPFGEAIQAADKLVFDVTTEGVALTLVDGSETETHFGAYEGEIYSRFEGLARKEAGLDELVILAEAA